LDIRGIELRPLTYGEIQLWDTARGVKLGAIPREIPIGGLELDFSPDADTLAVSRNRSGSIDTCFYDVATQQMRKKLGNVRDPHFSGDGREFQAVSGDRSAA